MKNAKATQQTLDHYTVNADRVTGEFDMSSLVCTGTVNKATWPSMKDTDDVHYDTYEHFPEPGSVDSVTRAITVTFVG